MFSIYWVGVYKKGLSDRWKVEIESCFENVGYIILVGYEIKLMDFD